MNEIDRTNLADQTTFRLDEISKIENDFHEKINQRKSCSKKLSKYVAAFDYMDKVLIVLSGTSGGVSNNRNQKITKLNKKQKKKKHDKILMLPKSRLNSIETLVS